MANFLELRDGDMDQEIGIWISFIIIVVAVVSAAAIVVVVAALI